MQLKESVWFCLLVSCLGGLAGCEDPPPYAFAKVPVRDGAVMTDGGRNYDWLVTPNGFEVARPTSFTYFSRLNRQAIAEAIAIAPFTQHQLPPKPDELDADVYARLEMYLHPEPIKTLLTIPVSAEVANASFALSDDGKRLITLGDKLQVWNVDDGSVLHSAPFKESGTVYFAAQDDSCVLQTTTSIKRIDLTNGATRADHTTTGVASFCQSRDRKTMAILTTDRQLIVLDEDLQIRSQFPAKTWTGEIAMHPDGKWIIGNSDAGAVKWSLEVPGQAAEVLPAPKYNQMMHCVSGTRYDYWLDSSNYNAYDGQRFSTTTNQAYLFDFALVDTFVCDLDNGSWIFASAWRLTPDGTPQFVLQDLAIPGMVSSIPIAITPPPLKMAINADATTIAMATATSIDVIQRARWYDPAGNTPVRYAANLLRDGRLDQVEATARFLRSIPRYMYNQSGERIYSIMAAELADVWVSAETYDDQAMLERCQDWYHQGSELAITASAIRHHRIAWQSRGGGYADTVTQAGWADFERRMSLAIRDLQRLLDRDRPPESAFAFMIDCMRDSGMDREQVESLLQRYVELYPYEIDAHARLCFSLLQKWGGDEGEIGAYVTALAGVYPAEYAETLYARCALQLAAYANNSWEFAYGELSVRRIATEARKWMSNGTLTHNQAIHLLGIATHNRDEGFAREVAEYTVRHFNLRSHQLYHFDVPTYLDDARARSIETLRTTIDIE